MRKTGLEKAIDAAVAEFTEFVMDAVRGLPLKELAELRGEDLILRPEPEPRRRRPRRKFLHKPPPAATFKRAKLDHSKCAFPGCERNRFVRGHGFCGKHWKQWKRDEIEDAETYMAS